MQEVHHIIATCTSVILGRIVHTPQYIHINMVSLSSPTWRVIESFYESFAPNPPPRIRDPARPMQVICVGLPRSGTESLQKALLTLGYDYTYHVCTRFLRAATLVLSSDPGMGHAERITTSYE